MAQRTQVIMTCDVHDGEAEAATTVTFTVDGQAYECELCEAHLAEFREAMEVWSSFARPASRGRGNRSARPGRRTAGSDGGPAPAEVREWARAQGLSVSARGRVPAELLAAYEEAH